MKKTGFVALLVTVLLVACGTAPGSQTVGSSSSNSSRCETASAAQMDHIRAGVQGEQASNDVRSGSAVKSSDFENAWFVAAKVYGPGIEDGTEPGVWFITGDKASPGLTMSVNGTAKAYSDWPDASTTDAAATMSDDGAREAETCER